MDPVIVTIKWQLILFKAAVSNYNDLQKRCRKGKIKIKIL
jgi:hypothetical protein